MSVRLTELVSVHAYLKTCIDMFGGMSHIMPWDCILLAAIEMDIHQVIRQCRYKPSVAL